jgi:ATP-dependent HslUV protease ATP-binding subunit HslU
MAKKMVAPIEDGLVRAAEIENLTPREIAAELDKYVIGQRAAKRAVAIALRNRWRRQQIHGALAEEIMPKNILMIGPTGVGKTEIARRLARLAKAPFMKIEASKFTEVGYVGRDCESMVRDLMEMAFAMVKEEKSRSVQEKAAENAEDRLLALLVPGSTFPSPSEEKKLRETREKFRERLRDGRLDDGKVEIEVEDKSGIENFGGNPSAEEISVNLREMMPSIFGTRRQKQTVTVIEALEILKQQEAEKLIDQRQVAAEARTRLEQGGIIFLDEIDKIAVREGTRHGPDISREGVQRDLLPIVEGTTVSTKYGMVKTDHILFIAAGAFHLSKPSDLIPELQGRLPIRVELQALTEGDFVRILTEPEAALTKQYAALLATEQVTLTFQPEAIVELARLAVEVNSRTENIGARRLATLMERLLEEVSFEAPQMAGVAVSIDAAYVRRALNDIVKDEDLSRYVL